MTHSSKAQRRLLSTAETAALLNVSPRSVRREIKSGALRVHRIGRSVRVSEEDLDRYLERKRT
jgi:excisionase family DNA binding protein